MKTPLQQSILLIDDNQTNLKVLMDCLKTAGFKVKTARNGEMGIRRAQFAPPNLILLDVMMPGMDGFETCRRLKADDATKDIPIIFMTVLNDVESKLKGFDAGGVDYVTKPIEEREVLARVHTQLELQRTRKTLEAYNQELIETARLREDVERITRHDLKTPLSAVINYPQCILRNMHLTEDEREYLKRIEGAGYRMLRMINRSLDLVKMERGMYHFTSVSVNLVQILGRIAAELSPLIQKKSLKMEIVLNGQPAGNENTFVVLGEDLLCYSVLANLIKNAIEASPEGDVVTVNLAGKEMASIQIHNNGVVPEHIHHRFFEKYVTSGKNMRGTGLGAYSAKLMAETQHGTISMSSSAQEGTTITVRLPKGDEQAYSSAADSGEHSLKIPPMPQLQHNAVLTPEAMAAIPAELVATFEEAVEFVDMEMINAAIVQIRTYNASLADTLAQLVDNFDYDEILKLLQKRG